MKGDALLVTKLPTENFKHSNKTSTFTVAIKGQVLTNSVHVLVSEMNDTFGIKEVE